MLFPHIPSFRIRPHSKYSMNDSTIAGAQQQPEQQQLLTTTQALMVVSVISIPAAARLPTCLPLAAMWQRPVVLLLLFLMLPLRISAVDMDDWPEHFCGNQLTKELDKICNGSYASSKCCSHIVSVCV